MNSCSVAHAVSENRCETTKSLKICYLFNISQGKVCCTKNSDVSELKRLINSEWAALSRTIIIECADGKWHQVYAFAFMLEVDILTTCCNKDDVMRHV